MKDNEYVVTAYDSNKGMRCTITKPMLYSKAYVNLLKILNDMYVAHMAATSYPLSKPHIERA